MLTYELKKSPGVPLYEALYRCIRQDILSGKLAAGEKLPSKRALALHLEVSKITVETAYNQLLTEGYIRSLEKVGYFVETLQKQSAASIRKEAEDTQAEDLIDLTGNSPSHFPFSVWSRLQREVMLDLGEGLLLPLHRQGLPALRNAIARHLNQFRGMQVDPDNILIGAGTDFLYNLLVQLLGRDKRYGVEEPGYSKIQKIYEAAGAVCSLLTLDREGVDPEDLGDTQVLHISPSHHFPSGIVMSPGRRQTLLNWAAEAEDRFIIEDDYDSEFRFNAHPMPALHTLDGNQKVIYLNTFSKTLAPSIRISYMVLPEQLMEVYRKKLGFYSCTVPSFEQHTLERFISRGHFEKHINRMRKLYKSIRNRILTAITSCAAAEHFTILEEHAGLHFLLQVDLPLTDAQLVEKCRELGLRVAPLSSYYRFPEENSHCLVLNYSGLTEETLAKLEHILDNLTL